MGLDPVGEGKRAGFEERSGVGLWDGMAGGGYRGVWGVGVAGRGGVRDSVWGI